MKTAKEKIYWWSRWIILSQLLCRVQQSIDIKDNNKRLFILNLLNGMKAKEEILNCSIRRTKKPFTSLCDKYYLDYNVRAMILRIKQLKKKNLRSYL